MFKSKIKIAFLTLSFAIVGFAQDLPQVILDVLERPVTITLPDGQKIEYAYDVSGNRISMKDWHGETKYIYDEFNKLVEVEFPTKDVLKYQYDVLGKVSEITYPDLSVVKYEYDSDNRLSKVIDSTGITSYEYDNKRNLLIKQTLSNKITTEYEYDNAYRIVGVCHKNAQGDLIASFQYKFDANNNRTQVVHKTPTSNLATDYKYDKLDRLVEAASSDGYFEKFTYDCRGNCLTKVTSSATITYVYDDKGRLIKANEEQFSYDERGNLIKKTSPQGTTEYGYNYCNQLVRYKDHKNEVLFEYDGNGVRIAKIVNGVKTSYIQNALSMSYPLMEKRGNSLVRLTYGSSRLNRIENNKSCVYLYDSPGRNVSYLLDAEQNLINCYNYASFGALRVTEQKLDDNFAFAGEELDKETGLIFLRNRYYDPEIGRFISPDVIPGTLDNPQTLNSYIYVKNNPINFIDRTGLTLEDPSVHIKENIIGEDEVLFQIWAHGISIGHIDQLIHTWVEVVYSDGTKTIASFTRAGLETNAGDHHLANPSCISFVLPKECAQIGLDAIREAGKKKYNLFFGHDCQELSEIGAQAALREYFKSNEPVLVMDGNSHLVLVSKETAEWLLYTGNPSVSANDDIPFDSVAKPAEMWDPRIQQNKIDLFWSFVQSGKNWEILPKCADPQAPKINLSCTGPIYTPSIEMMPWEKPDLGGVALNKSANVLLDLANVMGAFFDKNTGQLVLFGKKNNTLPLMNVDDLAVAIRSIYGLAGEAAFPAVSIEPGKDSNRMEVKYFGAIQNTAFGHVMFECDLLLKKLLLGQDPETKKPFSSKVPGYKSLFDRHCEKGEDGSVCGRLWFVPQDITLVESENKQEMLFSSVKMQLLTETKLTGQAVANQCAEDFAKHFTEHFDDFAKEFPILEELKVLGKVTAVVKWIADNHLCFDFLDYFKAYTPKKGVTPNFTAKLARGTASAFNGQVTLANISGGVYYFLGEDNYFVNNWAQMNDFGKNALECRGSENNFSWDFQSPLNGEEYRASACFLQKSRKRGNVKKSFLDMSLPLPGGESLIFCRTYNSFNDQRSALGIGWDILPAKMRLVGDKLENKDGKSAFSGVYLKNMEGESFLQLVNFDSLTYANGPLCIRKNDEHTWSLFKNAKEIMRFNILGNVTQVFCDNACEIDYQYDGEKLLSISCGDRAINLEWNKDQLVKARGEHTVYEFFYDMHGQLARVQDEEGHKQLYEYDENFRLIKMSDAYGKILFVAKYDDYNRAIFYQEGQNTITREYNLLEKSEKICVNGKVTEQNFDEYYRLLSSKSEHGEIKYVYDDAKHSVEEITQLTHKTFRYNEQGQVIYLKDAVGGETFFTYDFDGRLFIKQLPNGNQCFWSYDKNGRVHAITYSLNNIKGFSGDNSFSAFEIDTAKEGHYTIFDYDDLGNLTSVTDGKGHTTTLFYDDRGHVVKIKKPSGYTTSREIDSKDRVTKIYDDGGCFVSYTYDDNNKIRAVTTSAGTLSYTYEGKDMNIVDRKGFTTKMTLDDEGQITSLFDAEGQLFKYKVLKD